MADPLLSDKKPESNAALKDFVAGGVGGIAQLVTGHPLDTMKVCVIKFQIEDLFILMSISFFIIFR